MPRGVPRIPEPREWVLTQRCSRCRQVKPWALFTPDRRWPDGTVRTVNPICKRCKADLFASYRARNRERIQARQREWVRGRRRAGQREARLPAAPLRVWLDRWLSEDDRRTIVLLAELAGVSDRILRRILNREQENVSLDVADRCLVATGGHLNDLYPMEVGV